MNHKGTITLETKNLVLRKFEKSDSLNAFNNWTNDDEVTKFLTWKSHKNVRETTKYIKSCIWQYKKLDCYNWAIELKSINQVIGSIRVVRVDNKLNTCGIGYCIGKQWWHRGYTSEALSEVIKFLFQQVETYRIESTHAVENPNSGKVMQKCGMLYEGTLRKSGICNQGIIDVCHYSILLDDYLKRSKSTF